MPADFPVDDVIEPLLQALASAGVAVLEAPPGAGKSTRVPLRLLEAGWGNADGDRPGRILMLEPRRVAARSVATFMARQLGEPVGQTVGYRTRTDTRVSPATRLEVVTEGVLTRMALADPELSDVSLVIFDEFHERSINADLGLTLVREIREALREDLAVLVMSATLDCGPLENFLQAPVIRSEGRAYPVTIEYRPPVPQLQGWNDWRDHCAAVIHALLADSAQGVGVMLVFLPGQGEIRHLARALSSTPATVAQLHGSLPLAQQQQVLEQAAQCHVSGSALVVLATNVAETSLTIEGVSHVLDSGLAREAQYDPTRHRSRLVTRRISAASARQRAGRAGRLGPGHCLRLWSESEIMATHQKPEIQRVGLDQLVLDLARWGCTRPDTMHWLDSPPAAAWQSAVARLRAGEALDEQGRLTDQGRAIAAVGIEPALAMLVIAGKAHGLANTAARVAALLQERDIGQGRGVDLRLRLQLLQSQASQYGAILAEAKRLQQADQDTRDWSRDLGLLLARVYAGQIARRRGGRRGYYQMADGPGVRLPDNDALLDSEWLLVLDTDGEPRDARIRLAMPLTDKDIEAISRTHVQTVERAGWDRERQRVIGRKETVLGAIVLSSQPLGQLSAEQLASGLLEGLRDEGLSLLPWSDSSQQWLARLRKLAAVDPDGQWPAVDDEALLATLEAWLLPYLNGMRTLQDLKSLPLQHALDSLLSHEQQQRLAREMPRTIAIPSGREASLDYAGETVVLAVKLQELFGLKSLPAIAAGKLRISAHLLTPAGRPAAITDNLERFWRENYAAVRKDLRGRYPKHPWPEDPLQAVATAKTKSRL